MIIVADSAPLIFLAKINQLPLLTGLFNAEILVPVVVRNEILGPDVPPDEERLLTGFLSGCQVAASRKPTRFAQALSYADNCILTLAVKKQASVVLSDDRLLRKTAVIEGIRVIGTIGILIRATKASLLTAKKSVELLDELVEEHNFRISTRVYEIARKAFDQVHPNGSPHTTHMKLHGMTNED
jgi:predicted nucleic acid-binding protein